MHAPAALSLDSQHRDQVTKAKSRLRPIRDSYCYASAIRSLRFQSTASFFDREWGANGAEQQEIFQLKVMNGEVLQYQRYVFYEASVRDAAVTRKVETMFVQTTTSLHGKCMWCGGALATSLPCAPHNHKTRRTRRSLEIVGRRAKVHRCSVRNIRACADSI